MWAHPTWQRPLWCHISYFQSVFSSRQAPRLLHGSYLAFTSHLLDLIIIEISSDNYQYKRYRRASGIPRISRRRFLPPQSITSVLRGAPPATDARHQISTRCDTQTGRSASSVRRSRRLASRFMVATSTTQPPERGTCTIKRKTRFFGINQDVETDQTEIDAKIRPASTRTWNSISRGGKNRCNWGGRSVF